MACGISLRGHCKRQNVLVSARSKMSMSPSLAPALRLCKGPHLFSSKNPISRYATGEDVGQRTQKHPKCRAQVREQSLAGKGMRFVAQVGACVTRRDQTWMCSLSQCRKAR